MAWIWTAILAAALLLLLAARLSVGYAPPRRQLVRLRPWSVAFIQAVGETLFPPGGALPPSAEDTDIVGYLDRWYDAIPSLQRRLLLGFFLLMEHSPLVFGPHIRRFSALSAAERVAVFTRIEQHPWYWVRSLLTSLRMVFGLAWLDQPAVQEALGMKDRKHCAPRPTTHLRPDDRGTGALLDLDDHGAEVTEECDVVVVGTGAGGGVAAQQLAAAGLKVVIVEEGPFLRPEEVARDTGMGMAQTLYEAGLRVMLGPTAVPTIQGRVVGGSTFPNSAILFRIPDHVLEEWHEQHGVEGLTNDVLTAAYAQVEAATGKRRARPEQLGPKNVLFGKGAEVLGIPAEPFDLAKVGCCGCGTCMPSCPVGAKRSIDISHIPDAVRSGARLYVRCRVEKVVAKGGEARGIEGTFLDALGNKRGRLRVRARAVVLSGGVFGTPIILRKSGLANSSGQVGRNLHAHPGTAIYGVFDDPVEPWVGSTQGYGAFIDHHLKVEVLWSPLPLMAVRMPGFGLVLKERLSLFRNIAVWDAVVRGTSTGRIISYAGNNPTVWFSLNRPDTDHLVRGMKIVSEMAFAAGARAVMSGLVGLPDRFTSPSELAALAPGAIHPGQLTVAATHLFGTCRMGADPRRSVVNSRGESHDVKNLFVCDSSVFPSGTGVNPQEPIMVVSHHFAQGIIERLRTN